MTAKKLPPIHPGEILLEEFLRPMGITPYRLARAIKVDPRRIHAIIHGERSISPETALRLSRYFGMSEQFWMNLQSRYDLEIEKDLHGKKIAAEVEEVAHAR
jgi:addiction module HigA family antidote